MPAKLRGRMNAQGLKVGIVVSRFNEFVTDRLLDGAIRTLEQHGASGEDITVVSVPGSFEIPLAAEKLAAQGRYQALICLGAVIRGATSHHHYISAEVTKGIGAISQKYGIPVGFGVITTENVEQAIERAGTKMGNKGEEAARSVIEMANLLKEL